MDGVDNLDVNLRRCFLFFNNDINGYLDANLRGYNNPILFHYRSYFQFSALQHCRSLLLLQRLVLVNSLVCEAELKTPSLMTLPHISLL